MRQKIFCIGLQLLPAGAVELLDVLFKNSHPTTAELMIDLAGGAVTGHSESKFELGQVIHAGPALTQLDGSTLPRDLRVSGLVTPVVEHMFDIMALLGGECKENGAESTACRLVGDPRGGWYERSLTVE